MKTLRILYLCGGLALAGWYGFSEGRAHEPSTAAYERIDPSVRVSTGSSSGSSGSHFWFSGSHGGK